VLSTCCSIRSTRPSSKSLGPPSTASPFCGRIQDLTRPSLVLYLFRVCNSTAVSIILSGPYPSFLLSSRPSRFLVTLTVVCYLSSLHGGKAQRSLAFISCSPLVIVRHTVFPPLHVCIPPIICTLNVRLLILPPLLEKRSVVPCCPSGFTLGVR
jgi:hypothetical protein